VDLGFKKHRLEVRNYRVRRKEAEISRKGARCGRNGENPTKPISPKYEEKNGSARDYWSVSASKCESIVEVSALSLSLSVTLTAHKMNVNYATK
jgi:hypothetical protein